MLNPFASKPLIPQGCFTQCEQDGFFAGEKAPVSRTRGGDGVKLRRQIFKIHHRKLHIAEVFHTIAQFSDVALPRMTPDTGLRPFCQCEMNAKQALEVVNEQHHVAPPFLQGRNMNGDDVDAIIEVTAKAAVPPGGRRC